MFKFALPMIPETICLWIMLNMDRVMLKELSDMEDVGLYAVASTFALGGHTYQSVCSGVESLCLFNYER